MEPGLGSLALGFVAGALSTLSPCVLPLVPVLLASALQQHALGPLALAGGLAVSSAAMGLFTASLSLVLDVDAGLLRLVGAATMLALGLVLLVPALQERFALAAAPATGWAGRLLQRLPSAGLGAQVLLGILLGVVWVPCTGPTLGVAIGLAAQRETVLQAAALMTVFGLGAAAPLLALAYGSRQAVLARRDRLKRLSALAKPAMGLVLVAVGALVLTGVDKRIESHLTDAMPEWLLALTTRY
jgi:cytochrome c biogenesis protein CcdA